GDGGVLGPVALGSQTQRPFVKGLPCAATGEGRELPERADTQLLFVRTSHPQFLVERWRRHFGGDYAEELCKWNNRPARIYGRINQLKTDRKIFLQLYPDSRPLPENWDFVEFNTLPVAPL